MDRTLCITRAALAPALAAAVLVLGACSHAPRIDVGDDLVLGCPAPISSFDPPRTLTDGAAVLALAEAMTLCDDELITHGEDREFQARLALQERLEKIDRKRAREARLAQGRAKVDAAAWHADPAEAPPR